MTSFCEITHVDALLKVIGIHPCVICKCSKCQKTLIEAKRKLATTVMNAGPCRHRNRQPTSYEDKAGWPRGQWRVQRESWCRKERHSGSHWAPHSNQRFSAGNLSCLSKLGIGLDAFPFHGLSHFFQLGSFPFPRSLKNRTPSHSYSSYPFFFYL